jgi:membrane-associated phospholipid phosphatase
MALVGLVGLVSSLDRLVLVDDGLWRSVLLMRGCATDVIVDRTVDLATMILTVIFAVATVMHVRAKGFASAWPWVSTCGLGLFVSKTLKHLLTRERPSSLPDVALGYSFPSAHVMNSIAATIAVAALARGFRHRNLWAVAAGLLTLTVTAGRILLGRHWACDAVGGGLAALVLMGLVVPAVVRRPASAPAVLALVLAAAFTLDQWLGSSGLRLPAPLIGSGVALVDVDVGERLRPALVGSWREAAEEQRVGTLVWLEGSGLVPIEIPAEVAVSAGGAAGRALRVALGGRTEKTLSSCMTLGIDLNGRSLARFVPFSGWREYRLPIPPGLLHAGRNELAISAETPEGPARFAVTYVRVAGESAAE